MSSIPVQQYPHLAGFDGLSERCMKDHFHLYEGYVRKYNELFAQLESLQALGSVRAGGDKESLKVDIAFALGAIKNHELYFDILGNDGHEPTGELAEEIARSFHSVPQYLLDLKQTALLGRGWAWTAYDLDQGYLFNYEAGAQNGMPVWNTFPILAVDLYGHAYFYDFGNNRLAYVETFMGHIAWNRVAARLAAAKAGKIGRLAWVP